MATPEQKGVLPVLPRQRQCLRKWTLTCSDQVPEVQVLNLQLQVGSVPTPGAPVQLPVPPTPLWVRTTAAAEQPEHSVAATTFAFVIGSPQQPPTESQFETFSAKCMGLSRHGTDCCLRHLHFEATLVVQTYVT